MKVELKNPWFDPSATYRDIGVHDGIPESWRKLLPKDAEVLEDDVPAVVKKPKDL